MVSSEENADNRLVEIGNQKMEVVLQETFTDVPYCFFQLLSYVQSLQFNEEPDYLYIKNILAKEFILNEFSMDFQYDFITNHRTFRYWDNDLLYKIKVTNAGSNSYHVQEVQPEPVSEQLQTQFQKRKSELRVEQPSPIKEIVQKESEEILIDVDEISNYDLTQLTYPLEDTKQEEISSDLAQSVIETESSDDRSSVESDLVSSSD